MDRFIHEDRRHRTDVSTVESQRNDLIPEEFPVGRYGSGLQVESLGTSKPWRIEQRSPDRFDYENQAGLSLEYPGEDDYDAIYPEVHDEP
ncbi:hypothetical protein [Paenibacillus harenae]|uniref:hypothetical protein n=1 Tax=Paenibacillus harenae TaxID=306543 RepID=UPI000423CEC7|nr:hypothetical protein [Paenibacillus harenae]